MSYGLNVQAVCNSNCCFLYFGVVAPGKCPDQKAFERTKRFQIVSNFHQRQYIVVGDAAYTLTDQVLCPFVGSQRDSTNKDAYNYFLSQLRIKIEMTFGLLICVRCLFAFDNSLRDSTTCLEVFSNSLLPYFLPFLH